jgi:hypothetical protein
MTLGHGLTAEAPHHLARWHRLGAAVERVQAVAERRVGLRIEVAVASTTSTGGTSGTPEQSDRTVKVRARSKRR